MDDLSSLHGQRRRRLTENLRSRGSIAVAFSGGVDSTVLLHAAHCALGDNCLAVLADSHSLPRSELAQARTTAAAIGARLVEVQTDELGDERYARNQGDRCYHCKHALFRAMAHVCTLEQIPSMAFGEIMEDLQDDRPGKRAAQEFQVLAPLSAAGFTKEDVRLYAREAGLEVWDKPASACLASRIPRGTRVTVEALSQVEQAEDALHRLGLKQVRVRHLGRAARLEVGQAELGQATALAERVGEALKTSGFVTYELQGYIPPDER